MLELSADFDTVDRNVLLAQLKGLLGISDKALHWFESYLTNQSQHVCIQATHSDPKVLKYGVPGPILFSFYILALGSLLQRHSLLYH